MTESLKQYEIHPERGKISEENPRFINQVILSALYPDIFPTPLILRDEQHRAFESTWRMRFPVEKFGEELEQFIKDNSSRLSIKDIIEIHVLILEQIRKVYDEKGILIGDRHRANILVKEVREHEHGLQLSRHRIQMKQTDLEEVYDAVTGQGCLDLAISYKERNFSHHDVKNFFDTRVVIDRICQKMLFGLKSSLATIEQEDHKFYAVWEMVKQMQKQHPYSSTENPLSFEQFITFFDEISYILDHNV